MTMSLLESRAAFERGELSKPAYIDARHELHRVLFEYASYLPQTDIARIEISDEGVVMTTRRAGVRFACDPADKRIAPVEILNFGGYEDEEFAVVASLCGPGFRVLDVGANIGWFSLSLALTRPDVSVQSFEPVPGTFAYLKRNVELNGAGNVRIHNFGFSDAERDLAFYFYPEGSGNASSANLAERDDAQLVTCRVRRLDDFMAEDGGGADLIKCDVEGAELFALRGAEETLRRDRPILFVEMLRKWAAKFGYHPNEIIQFLEPMGYRCFWIGEGGRLQPLQSMDEGTAATNFLFLHAEKHAQLAEARR